MVVGVVGNGMVSGCLQGERFVEAVAGEIPLIGGSEVKPVGSHTLLGGQVPAAVRAGAGGRVFVLLTHADGLPAVEAPLGQGAHILLSDVALGVAAPCQQLLALWRGGGEAIRVRRSVQPRQEGKRRVCEKKTKKKKVLFPVPNLKLSIKHLAAPHTLPLQHARAAQ